MTYNDIIEVLSKTQTVDAKVCRVINSRMSKQGLQKLVVPSNLFQAIGMNNPYWDFIIVQFLSPTEIKKCHNGGISREHYSFTKSYFDAKAKIELDDETGVVTWFGLPNGFRYTLGKLGEDEIHPFEWAEKPSKSTPAKPKASKPVPGSILVENVQKSILEGANNLPITMTSPMSHGNKVTHRYSYVQTLTEYLQAYGLNESAFSDVYIPTHLRTTDALPFPWGGLSDDKDGEKFSPADKINMAGEDIGKFKWSIPNINVMKVLKSIDRVDTKLISSVGEPCIGDRRYNDIPVEAFWETSYGSYDYEGKGLWTWADDDAAIGFVVRNHNYIVSKGKLQDAVRKKVDRFKITKEKTDNLRPNTFGDSKKKKWCAWFTQSEIKEMSTLDFPMHPLYGELLEKHACDLLDLYSDKEKGEAYTNRQLRVFSPHV